MPRPDPEYTVYPSPLIHSAAVACTLMEESANYRQYLKGNDIPLLLKTL
jgi:hypothetical protein